MTVMGCPSWADSWVLCSQSNFRTAVCLRATGEKPQAKAVPSVQALGSHREAIHTPRDTAQHCSCNGFTHLGSHRWALAGCPSPRALPCHSTAQSHKQGLHWELHLLSLGSFCSQTMLKSLQPLWPISVTAELSRNKPTGFQTDLSHRAGLHNECLHHTYPQHGSTKGLLGTRKTVPFSHRHLTFDFNSHSPGIDLIALWGRIPADSEPGPHSMVSLSAWITHYATILTFPVALPWHFIWGALAFKKKKKTGFLHYRGVHNG